VQEEVVYGQRRSGRAGILKAPTMALQVPGPAAPSPPPSTDTPGDSSKANSRGISPLMNHSKWKIIVLN